ncbi:MAG TPA: hypothetical protein VJK54_09860 [Chthoniobacterales bacterium]|nr:hypothetical protein [Chthoniobacterales bacterium]
MSANRIDLSRIIEAPWHTTTNDSQPQIRSGAMGNRLVTTINNSNQHDQTNIAAHNDSEHFEITPNSTDTELGIVTIVPPQRETFHREMEEIKTEAEILQNNRASLSVANIVDFATKVQTINTKALQAFTPLTSTSYQRERAGLTINRNAIQDILHDLNSRDRVSPIQFNQDVEPLLNALVDVQVAIDSLSSLEERSPTVNQHPPSTIAHLDTIESGSDRSSDTTKARLSGSSTSSTPSHPETDDTKESKK